MLKYTFTGFGEMIPDDKVLDRMSDFGVEMSFERRKDNLITLRMTIDEESIAKRRRRKAKAKEAE